MKLLIENWRKLLEGDVIKGPWDKPSHEPEQDEFGQTISPYGDIKKKIRATLADLYNLHGDDVDLSRKLEEVENLLMELFPSDDD